MQFIKDMKISAKLIVSFLIIGLISVVVGVVGIRGMDTISQASDEMYQENAQAMGNIATMYDLLSTQRIAATNMVLFLQSDPQFSQDEGVSLSEKEAGFEEALANYEGLVSNEAERQILNDLQAMYYNDFAVCKQNVRDAVSAGDEAAMIAAVFALDGVGSDLSNYLDEANSLNNTLAAATVAENQTLTRQGSLSLIIVLIIGMGLAVVLSIYMSSLISKPLKSMMGWILQAGKTGNLHYSDDDWALCDRLSQRKDEIGQSLKAYGEMMRKFVYYGAALNKISHRDMSVRVETLGAEDTFGTAITDMAGNLSQMLMDINSASEQVSLGSNQVASAAQTLAQGSTEQAASTQQLSGSITNVAEKTKANAERAEHSAQLAEKIKGAAEMGSRQMDQMMSAVGEISEASQSIAKVIKTIEDIAFQTNILALNAAVEAARAGQHGKGFAVVADEVRNLAAKSATAAEDTEQLIADAIAKANLGERIAGETATSLAEIVEGINESAEIVSEIAESSEAQAQAIVEINIGVDQVAQVVQANSATAEESAAASEEMSSQAQILKQLVAQFKLQGQEYNALPSARPYAAELQSRRSASGM